jgi:ElaB/YqjD/DUF883 family membrane-anchored ribosome-binding protein
MTINLGATMNNVNTEKLVSDVRAVIFDAEELLRATAAQTGERVEKVRAKAEESLRAARERLQNAGYTVESQARDAAAELNDQVRLHPWTTAGIAAAVGLLLGILIGRR